MAGKNNINFYAHNVGAHNDWRFKTLRRKYGWAGEGKFYALCNMIGQEEACVLYLQDDEKLYQIAADLDMEAEELQAFLEYLVKPCKLLQRDPDGGLRWEETDEALGEVATKRERQRNWKRERSKSRESTSTAQESTVEIGQRRGEEKRGEEKRGEETNSPTGNIETVNSLPAGGGTGETEEEGPGEEEINSLFPTDPEPPLIQSAQDPAAPRRDENGRFVPKNGAKTAAPAQKPARPAELWQPFVQAWYEYNQATAREEPTFRDRDPRYLGQIYDRLADRARKKGGAWTAETAAQALKSFLAAADGHEWLSKNFQLKYLLEKFDTVVNLAQTQGKQPGPRVNYEAELRYLFGRFLEGELDKKQIRAEHFAPIASFWSVSEACLLRARQKRVANLQGTNEGRLIRLREAYVSGQESAETLEDQETLLAMARRLSVLEYFEQQKRIGEKEILKTVTA